MKSLRWLILGLGIGILASGCILTSGQIQLDFAVDDGTVTSNGLVGMPINLSDEEEYQDHKEDIKNLSDLAFLGKFTNNTPNAFTVEVWMTQPTTLPYTDEGSMKADPTAVKIWGNFSLAGNQTKQIDWNESAHLFTKAGKDALLKEARDGDGNFTLYAIGSSGTYDFDIKNGALVLVLDAGI
ncbi:MAG TPA: hypothetical protein VFX78_00265 [Candidatus Eisenbacteria bacterium]|jgi:hypothetical protein|nr:hypothetical protein [Candidatus Eisenbacteria bacterium]